MPKSCRCGQAEVLDGDSLDAISFVLGPPIPEEWTPRTHHLFPQRMRSAVRTLLLASQRSGDDCLWGKLDRDTLFQIIATTCRVCSGDAPS